MDYVIIARDKGVVDEGRIQPFIQTSEWWQQVPAWNNDYTIYARTQTKEEADILLSAMPTTKWAAIQWSKSMVV